MSVLKKKLLLAERTKKKLLLAGRTDTEPGEIAFPTPHSATCSTPCLDVGTLSLYRVICFSPEATAGQSRRNCATSELDSEDCGGVVRSSGLLVQHTQKPPHLCPTPPHISGRLHALPSPAMTVCA